eukprot:9478197-Pyramimonas_sp.AAC.1
MPRAVPRQYHLKHIVCVPQAIPRHQASATCFIYRLYASNGAKPQMVPRKSCLWFGVVPSQPTLKWYQASATSDIASTT